MRAPGKRCQNIEMKTKFSWTLTDPSYTIRMVSRAPPDITSHTEADPFAQTNPLENWIDGRQSYPT
jgi:hypothetical protein